MTRGGKDDMYLFGVLRMIETASVPDLALVLEKLSEELDGRRLGDAAGRCRDAVASIRHLRVGDVAAEVRGTSHGL